MIQSAQLAQLAPAKRAQVIFAEAQSQLSNRLWRAALGEGDSKKDESSGFGNGMDMDSLLGLLQEQPGAASAAGACACRCACSCHAPTGASGDTQSGSDLSDLARSPAALGITPSATVAATTAGFASGVQLGANARYAPAFASAEARTGIPAPALAAIVDAEAAKDSGGRWNAHSRNPRSSAAGLGQFLSGTWQELAQTQGTWLNQYASERGWLDGRGRVQTGARAELLALRYDPQASILGVADLAKSNLDRLEKAGVRVRTDSETLAKAAYLGHHLGLGDARKFLSGGIDAGRARMLLAAQIGAPAADQRIASAGNATQAHRVWLLGFIDRRIRPEAFAA